MPMQPSPIADTSRGLLFPSFRFFMFRFLVQLKIEPECHAALVQAGLAFHFRRRRLKSLTEHLWFEVPGRRGFINITPKIEHLVDRSGVTEGLCLVSAMH